MFQIFLDGNVLPWPVSIADPRSSHISGSPPASQDFWIVFMGRQQWAIDSVGHLIFDGLRTFADRVSNSSSWVFSRQRISPKWPPRTPCRARSRSLSSMIGSCRRRQDVARLRSANITLVVTEVGIPTTMCKYLLHRICSASANYCSTVLRPWVHGG